VRWNAPAFGGNGRTPTDVWSNILERKTYRVSEVVQITGLGRSTIYKLIGSGAIGRIKIGVSTLIPAADVDALLQRRAA